MIASLDEIHKSTLFDTSYLRSEQSSPQRDDELLSLRTMRAKERGMSFAVVGETKSFAFERGEVGRFSTIVARRERSLRTPSSYSAEHGPR